MINTFGSDKNFLFKKTPTFIITKITKQKRKSNYKQ